MESLIHKYLNNNKPNQNSPNIFKPYLSGQAPNFLSFSRKGKDVSFTCTFTSFFFRILTQLIKNKSKHIFNHLGRPGHQYLQKQILRVKHNKRRGTSPINVLTTSSTNVLNILKYDVLRTSQCNVLKTSPHCPICNAIRRPFCRRCEDVLKTTLYGSVSKDQKRPRDMEFCIWSQHQ